MSKESKKRELPLSIQAALEAQSKLYEAVMPAVLQKIIESIERMPEIYFTAAEAAIRCLTVEQVAERLGVKPETVKEYIKKGLLKAVKPDGKRYYITAKNLHDFLNPKESSNESRL